MLKQEWNNQEKGEMMKIWSFFRWLAVLFLVLQPFSATAQAPKTTPVPTNSNPTTPKVTVTPSIQNPQVPPMEERVSMSLGWEERMCNGRFENDPMGTCWQQQSQYQIVTEDCNRSLGGCRFAWMGGIDSLDETLLSEVVDLQGFQSAELEFGWKINSEEEPYPPAIYDTIDCDIVDPDTLETEGHLIYKNNGHDFDYWTIAPFDIGNWDGHQFRIQCKSHTDSSNPTEFLLDEFTVVANKNLRLPELVSPADGHDQNEGKVGFEWTWPTFEPEVDDECEFRVYRNGGITHVAPFSCIDNIYLDPDYRLTRNYETFFWCPSGSCEYQWTVAQKATGEGGEWIEAPRRSFTLNTIPVDPAPKVLRMNNSTWIGQPHGATLYLGDGRRACNPETGQPWTQWIEEGFNAPVTAGGWVPIPIYKLKVKPVACEGYTIYIPTTLKNFSGTTPNPPPNLEKVDMKGLMVKKEEMIQKGGELVTPIPITDFTLDLNSTVELPEGVPSPNNIWDNLAIRKAVAAGAMSMDMMDSMNEALLKIAEAYKGRPGISLPIGIPMYRSAGPGLGYYGGRPLLSNDPLALNIIATPTHVNYYQDEIYIRFLLPQECWQMGDYQWVRVWKNGSYQFKWAEEWVRARSKVLAREKIGRQLAVGGLLLLGGAVFLVGCLDGPIPDGEVAAAAIWTYALAMPMGSRGKAQIYYSVYPSLK